MGTFRHKDIGTTLTQSEFENADLHTVTGQSSGDMVYADSATSWERVTGGSEGNVLKYVSGVPTWGSISSGTIDANDLGGTTLNVGVVNSSLSGLGIVTSGTWNAGTIPDGFGGTGQSSYAQGDLLYASGANTLAKLALGDADKVLTVNTAGTQIEWKTASGGGGGGFGTSYAVNLLFGKR